MWDFHGMSDAQYPDLWSDNPNAPKISHHLYLLEKANLAGYLVASILYGILIELFFRCMIALLNPTNRKGRRIEWGLISYTIVMFSLATIQTAASLYILSLCYIDNRDFPGLDDMTHSGPVGYAVFLDHEALAIVPNVMIFLNGWLADGLLLYRCYKIYTMNLWVIAFPCLLYLGSLAIGIVYIYQSAATYHLEWSALPYLSITLSLNILLTLMIVVRLIQHTRNTRAALGITGMSGLYKPIVTMLVESCALYAVSLLLLIASFSTKNPITNFFGAVLPQTQVIAALLIVLRVASRTTLTGGPTVSGRISAYEAKSLGEPTGGSGFVRGEDPKSWINVE